MTATSITMTASQAEWIRCAYVNRHANPPGVHPTTGGGVEDCEELVRLGYLMREDLDYVLTADGYDKARRLAPDMQHRG